MPNTGLALIKCCLVNKGEDEVTPFSIREANGNRSVSSLDYVGIFPRKSFTVGRDRGAQLNDVSIDNLYVSCLHFEIYSIEFDRNDPRQQPMVYVRDRQSLSGTLVNGTCIGSKKHGTTPGFLLRHGDVIQIQPYWAFVVHIRQHPAWNCPLQDIQAHEVKLFGDRYLVTDRSLGRGSFGTVHLALDVKRKTQLACKVMNLDQIDSGRYGQASIKEIEREVDIIGKVRHPNLLTLEHAFRSKHTVYIFTELATGGDLFSKLESYGGCFFEEDAKFIIHQVLRGIVYLHKHDLAHRDLKLENIYFSTGPGIRNRVLVGDFGHSKGTTWGRLRSNVGTDVYQSPEIQFKDGMYTKAVDFWSIGVIAFLIQIPCEEVPPFRTMDQATIDDYLTRAFTLSDGNQPLTEHAQNFIRRCLQVDAKQRMTAEWVKKHSWFSLPKLVVDEWTTLRNQWWKPSHSIPPPIENLPDLEHIVKYKHLEIVPKKARKRLLEQSHADPDSMASPYVSSKPSPSRAVKKSKKIETSAEISTDRPQTQ